MKLETKKVFIVFIVISFILSLIVGIKRSAIENDYKQIDLVMSLNKIRELSIKDGYDEYELLKELKSAGITSIAIQEDTIQTLVSQGKIAFFSTNDIYKANYLPDFDLFKRLNISNNELMIACKDDDLFKRIKDNLQSFLGGTPLKIDQIGEKNHIMIFQADEEDLMKLGLGFSKNDIEKIQEFGFNLILRPKNTSKITKDIIQQKIKFIEESNDISSLIFDEEEILGYPSVKMMAEVAKHLQTHDIPFGIIEFTSQKGIQSLSSRISNLALRVHSITKDEMDKISLSKAVERWLRAAQERNIRVFYINPFLNVREEGLVKFNLEYIEKINNQLIRSNFLIGKATPLPSFQVPIYYIFMIGLGSISAGILLLKQYFKFKEQYEIILFILLFLFLLLINNLFGKIILAKMLALATAIIFPTMAIIFNKKYFTEKSEEVDLLLTSRNRHFLNLKLLKNIFFGITRVMSISLAGGLLVAALLSNHQFMLAIQLFSGIKIAFILPITLVAFYYWWNDRSSNNSLLKEIKKPILFEHALLVLFIAVFGVIYITRSGNFSFLSISSVEEKIRIFLEKILIARPRNKEFLIGYPLLSIAIMMNYFKLNYLKIPIIIVGTVAPITIVNTFCHIHSPILFSLLRTFNGYWLGMLFSILIVSIFILFLRIFRNCVDGKRKQTSY